MTTTRKLWSDEEVLIDYTNYRGERSIRRIRPMMPNPMRFDRSDWHPEMQWLLRAHDIDKGMLRDFAMKDIHSWKPATPADASEERA